MHLNKKEREVFDNVQVSQLELKTEAELGYMVMRLVQRYRIGEKGKYHSAVGVLEGVKQELFRKHITPAAIQTEFDNGEL